MITIVVASCTIKDFLEKCILEAHPLRILLDMVLGLILLTVMFVIIMNFVCWLKEKKGSEK